VIKIKIVCENSQNTRLNLIDDSSPIDVISLDGFSETDYTITTSKNSGQDGETYTGATADKRNLVITGDIVGDFRRNRDKLYSFFQPRSEGVIYYYEDDTDAGREAAYYVESIKIDNYGVIRGCTISLICPDPLFYDLDEELLQLATWQGRIIFPLYIVDPFVVTEKVSTLIGAIYNASNVTQGITVKFRASGAVTNPSLYDVNRHNKMQINTTMLDGDQIVITTGQNDKRVQLVSGGVTTSINNLMAYPLVWLQAYPGDNLFRYDAESGIDNLNVSILRRRAYWGA